jgi:hypothetical protein
MSYVFSGTPLCQLTDVKSALRLEVTDTTDDYRISLAIDAATKQIQDFCGRSFIQDNGVSDRWYSPDTPWLCEVDDFQTVTGLVVETYPTGVQQTPTTWDTPDYQLEPLNGLLNGIPIPYESIRAVGSKIFPQVSGFGFVPGGAAPGVQALIKITAQWGWASIPADVVKATVVQSISLFKADDVPFGTTPFTETGILRLKPTLHPTVEALLLNYTRRALVG